MDIHHWIQLKFKTWTSPLPAKHVEGQDTNVLSTWKYSALQWWLWQALTQGTTTCDVN